MKKLFLALLLLSAAGWLKSAPLSGTYTIPGSYSSIAAAFSDLNTNGVSGPCEFLINAGYTETALSLTLTVPNAGYLMPITFKKDPAQSGSNPKLIVSAGSASFTDAGIIIAGTDYVTFENLDIDASAQTTIEWGYALVKKQNTAPFDGCQHITIKGCTITLNKVNTKSVGIYSGNHIATATTSLTITTPTDACNDCVFIDNTISNTFIGISLNGFGATSPYTLYDHNNEIGQYGAGKNRIFNFGGANTAAYGIYATNQDQIKVINDSIAGSTGSLNRLAGILLQSGVSSSLEVAFNDISVTSNTTGSQSTYGIWNLMGGTAASNTISFHDNQIFNCYSTVTSASGPLYGILNSASAENVNIYNNSFHNFILSTSGNLNVIRTEASAVNVNIYNNQIYNIQHAGSGPLTLIHSQGPTNSNIYSNILYNSSSSGGTVNGIYSALGTNINVYKNNMFNIECANGSSAASLVYGINNSSTPNITIYNNFISDLRANQATNDPAICGLYLTGGSNNYVYYNTVVLNAMSSGSTFGTAVVYTGITPQTILRNNIFENASNAGTSGHTVVYRRSGTSLGTYASVSNNNDFYVGSSPNSYFYYDGSVAISSFASYQALVSPADAASFNEAAPFVNATTTPFDLHIQGGVSTMLESGAIPVFGPDIMTDFDENPRFPNTGYPDNAGQPATNPDVGADEFAGGLPPVLTFTVDMSTCQGFVPGTDLVYLAGNFPGMTWNEPGSNPSLQMSQVGTSLTYSLTLSLPFGSYEYKYFRNAGWGGGEWAGGPNRSVTFSSVLTQNDTWGGSISWANLQWPGTGYISSGGGYDVYAQALIPNGITGSAGATYGLQAWIGYSTTDTDPSTWTNWVPAPFFGQSWDNDEFKADLGSVLTTPGTYYYASRFQYGNMPFVYGGFNGGFWDGTTNISGVLYVSAPSKTVNLKLLLQGLYDGSGMMLKAQGSSGDQYTGNVADKITVELHDALNYATVYHVDPNVDLTTSGDATLQVPSGYAASYYITIKHRNSIETVSAIPVDFSGSVINYYFDAPSKAYGSNLKVDGAYSLIYGGDENLDGLVDSSDMIGVDNDVASFATGYIATDVNGDGLLDSSDMILIDNNASNFVSSVLP